MGIIQSIFCSVSFCVERILTWVCCAYLLIMMLFSFVLLVIYGITVGYHYAQKELVSFAYQSRASTEKAARRAGGLPILPNALPELRGYAFQPQSFEDVDVDSTSFSEDLAVYRTKPTRTDNELFWDRRRPTDTPSAVEEISDNYEPSTELSQHEKELARRLLGRVRRAKHNTTPKNIELRRIIKYGQIIE